MIYKPSNQLSSQKLAMNSMLNSVLFTSTKRGLLIVCGQNVSLKQQKTIFFFVDFLNSFFGDNILHHLILDSIKLSISFLYILWLFITKVYFKKFHVI